MREDVTNPESSEEELEEVESLLPEILPEIASRRLELMTLKGKCLNVDCYRGYAPAFVLSAVSQPDVYDQASNKTGTQRDLSAAKAKDAHAYMNAGNADPSKDLRFLPEVILNVRNPDVIEIEDLGNNLSRIYADLEDLTDNLEDPDICRVEGNHRLAYAHGDGKRLHPITESISFCLTIGIPKLMEAKLFRDINDNQKKMNTSHLDNLDLRLEEGGGPAVEEFVRIADKLANDGASPFCNNIFYGGRKKRGAKFLFTLRALGSFVKLMLNQSKKLSSLDSEEQYIVIRAYWGGKSLQNCFRRSGQTARTIYWPALACSLSQWPVLKQLMT